MIPTTGLAVAPVVVTTLSGECLIGTVEREDAEHVTLVSQTLGVVRIPRAAIRTLTPAPETPPVAAAPAPAPAPAVAAAPASAPAAPPEPPPGFLQSRLHIPGKFDASLGAGIMAQFGIFEQTTWSASLDFAWEIGRNAVQSSIEAHRQTTHGVVLDDAARWDLQVRHNLNPKRFLLAASYYREDSIMAVDREEVLFAGLGFNLVKTPALEVVTVVGPSYIWQEYLPARPGLAPPPSLGDPAGVFYQSVAYTALPRVRVSASGLIAQSFDYREKQLARLILSLDFSLTKTLILSHSYFWMHDSMPRGPAGKSQGMMNTQLKLKL